jgi:hypothetical protein
MHFFVKHNFQFALLIVQSAKVKNNIFVASKSGLFSPFVSAFNENTGEV